MDVRKMLKIIFFFLVVVVVLALAPTINTANQTAWTTFNATSMNASVVGMQAVFPFGAPLIILGIMAGFGLLAFGMKDNFGIKDILGAIGIAIAQILALSFFNTIVTSVNTLMSGTTGLALTIYGILDISIYIGIIASSGIVQGYRSWKSHRKGGKKATRALAY